MGGDFMGLPHLFPKNNLSAFAAHRQDIVVHAQQTQAALRNMD